jgi:hypothetical protein
MVKRQTFVRVLVALLAVLVLGSGSFLILQQVGGLPVDWGFMVFIPIGPLCSYVMFRGPNVTLKPEAPLRTKGRSGTVVVLWSLICGGFFGCFMGLALSHQAVSAYTYAVLIGDELLFSIAGGAFSNRRFSRQERAAADRLEQWDQRRN